MIVIADASPLNYLILIGHVDVLQQMYGQVVVPAGVRASPDRKAVLHARARARSIVAPVSNRYPIRFLNPG